MITFVDDALDMADKLTAAGVRATTDPGALNPPAILVPPPRLEWDVGCGYTNVWNIHAIAAAPTGGDRATWDQLATLIDALASIYPLETAQPTAYVLQQKTFPSYLIQFTTPGG